MNLLENTQATILIIHSFSIKKNKYLIQKEVFLYHSFFNRSEIFLKLRSCINWMRICQNMKKLIEYKKNHNI